MKKYIATTITFLLLLLCSINSYASSWTDNWTFNGIPLSEFKDAKPSEYVNVAAGCGASMLVHWLGHVATLEFLGKDWHQDGLREVCDEPLSNSEARMFARAGMLSQLAVGTLGHFTLFKRYRYFGAGYHLGSFIEVSTYPLLWKGDGDLYTIDRRGGAAEFEYSVYTLWAVELLLN